MMNDFYFVWPEATPFFFSGSDVAILLLHGFTASPSEVKPLGERLQEYGYTVSAPLLPGHGSHPRHLNQVTVEQWKQAVRLEVGYLLAKYGRVVAAGLSMGGVLALWAVQEGYPLTGCVAINPALEVKNPLSRFSKPLSKTFNFLPKGKNKESERLEKQGRFAYEVVPIRAFRQFDQLRREVWQRVDEVRGNILILQASHDETVVAGGVADFFAHIPAASKEYVPLPQSHHVATMGPELDLISTSIHQCISRWQQEAG